MYTTLFTVSMLLATAVVFLICAACVTVSTGGLLLNLLLCDFSATMVPLAIDAILNSTDFFAADVMSACCFTMQSATLGNASAICDTANPQRDVFVGSMYTLGGALGLSLGQLMLYTSYHVVSEVAWRHMKDVRRQSEILDATAFGYVDSEDAARMHGYGARARARGDSFQTRRGEGDNESQIPDEDQVVKQCLAELQAEMDVSFYFMLADRIRNSGWKSFPVFEDLFKKNPDHIEKIKISASHAYSGYYVEKGFCIISHRWFRADKPDNEKENEPGGR